MQQLPWVYTVSLQTSRKNACRLQQPQQSTTEPLSILKQEVLRRVFHCRGLIVTTHHKPYIHYFPCLLFLYYNPNNNVSISSKYMLLLKLITQVVTKFIGMLKNTSLEHSTGQQVNFEQLTVPWLVLKGATVKGSVIGRQHDGGGFTILWKHLTVWRMFIQGCSGAFHKTIVGKKNSSFANGWFLFLLLTLCIYWHSSP